MKTSIATVSISGDFREKLSAIAGAGFDGIEIFEQDLTAFDATPAEVGAMVRDHGLTITLFQPFRDFEGLPEPLRSRAFARAAAKFDLMTQLGTDLMLVCSSVHPQALGGIDRAADDLRALGAMAADRGLRVGFEALAWGRHINDHRDAWEVVRRADHPAVGLILDSFHTLGRGIDPQTICRIPGDKIFFVQLADAPLIPMDLLYWSRHFRNMPGEGDLDIMGFMRAVLTAGYTGPLSLEIFNDQFRGGNPRLVAADGHRSLIYLMDRLRRESPALSSALTSAPLPPPSRVERVEFVEFATSPDEAEILTTTLHGLGFRRTAQHVSKQVTRWQQGAINILVNAEPTGYAHSAYIAHGTTVSDIALMVDDAAAVKTRALALGADSFDAPSAAGEAAIPAIRGVGGSVIRLVDASPALAGFWDIDFRPVTDPAPPKDAGLKHFDHLAQTMAYDEMLSWTSYYTTVFQATKAPMVDVIDPGGIVRSQAIEGGGLTLTLNGAETHRTLAGRFISETFGGSVQHIALSTEDIFATAKALATNGFQTLMLNANYYDDLAARFGLDADLLARLQAMQVMYDEDATGAFFQLYSRSLGGGLFFEIVQRVGRYAGYGAPNAPFRIAAQRRVARAAAIPRL